MPKAHNKTEHAKAVTPMSDELERARIALCRALSRAECRRRSRPLLPLQVMRPIWKDVALAA